MSVTVDETRVPDPFTESQEPADNTPAPEGTVLAPPSDFDDVDKMSAKAWEVSGELTYARGDQIEKRPFARTYVQEPLSYRGIVEFTGLIGRTIDEAMSGPTGMSLNGILDLAQLAEVTQGDDPNVRMQAIGQLIAANGDGINGFVKGFAKLAGAVPSLIDEAHCIWLRVPIQERYQVREIWNLPPSKGGLSGDDGELMMRIFIAQNYEELERFFVERLRRVFGTIQTARKRIHPGE